VSRTNCAIGKDVVPASFKGVQFYCSEANIEGGRRGAEGEFPFGEDTKYADLGRKIRVYHLTAIFREDDHVTDAQALLMFVSRLGPECWFTRPVAQSWPRAGKSKLRIRWKMGSASLMPNSSLSKPILVLALGLGLALLGAVVDVGVHCLALFLLR
jgi:hypothetical protein